MSETVKTIRNYIFDNFLLDGGDEDLDNDASFLDEGIVDSTGMLELVTWIQQTFGFEVSDDELIPDNLASVHKVANFVAAKAVPAAGVEPC